MSEEIQLGLFGNSEEQPKILQIADGRRPGSVDEPASNSRESSFASSAASRAETAPAATTPPGRWETVIRRHDLPDLQAVAREVEGCTLCPLCESRTKAVPGEGNPKARVMFVGEGPGAEEDRQGRPFVGAAGRLLDKIIEAMGLRRDEVFIGNIVKCRPPMNRTPEPHEMETCMPYLSRQVELVNPDIMVLLGGTSLKALIDPNAFITRARGRWLQRGGIWIMPTFHPAALLRDPSKKVEVWEDMRKVMAKMQELGDGR